MNLRGIDLNLLVVFDALMTERSVSRAAKRVGLSQPATSNALGRLRTAFDDPLFVRQRSAMVPTSRAEAIASHVRAGLGHLDVALGVQPAFQPSTAELDLVIATADYASLMIMPGLVRRVRRQAPHVRLKVVPYGPVRPFEALARSDVDMLVGPPVGLPPEITVGRVFEDGLTCLVRGDHPRVGRRLTVPRYAELDHLLVSPLGGARGPVDAALATLGRSRNVALRVPDFVLAPLIVATTDLIATLPSRIASLLATPLGLRALRPPLPLPKFAYATMWNRRRDSDPALTWLHALVCDAVTDGPVTPR